MKKQTGEETLAFVRDQLRAYMAAKEDLDKRIRENAKWYKSQHWDLMRSRHNPNMPEPTSAYLFNAIATKHADAMENYPEPVILPREPGDFEAAKTLTAILPFVLERSGFKSIYSRNWWYKLKNGAAVYGVLYNPQKRDIELSRINLLNIFWEPGVEDIQKSRFLFILSAADIAATEALYPHSRGKLGGGFSLTHAEAPAKDKCVIADCYYKVPLKNGRQAVHLIKFSGDVILDSSEERRATRDKGLYRHGKYPVVIDSLYPDDGSPVGFGLIDIAKNPQGYIDRLDQIISQNALISGKLRWLVKDSGGINENELLDLAQDVIHVAGSVNEDSIKEFQARPLDPFIAEHRQNKIKELKEVVGNRDLYSGGRESGITAYSAIVALQEAGNKLSRDMISESYAAYTEIVRMAIELIGQFYDRKHCFRITGEDGAPFIEFDASLLNGQTVYDISLRAEQQNPLTREALNQLALDMFKSGFFAPENKSAALAALELMQFDGKTRLVSMIQN